MIRGIAVAIGASLASAAFAQALPPDVGDGARPYAEFLSHELWSWHPASREMLVGERLDGAPQAHRVTDPASTPQPITDVSGGLLAASYQPTRGTYFVFLAAGSGGEAPRIHRYDLSTRSYAAVSARGARVTEFTWNRAGDRIAYAVASEGPGSSRVALRVVDPARPEGDRIVARLEGAGWSQLRFSEDGKRIACVETVSARDSRLWIVDLADGRKRRVDRPGARAPAAFRHPRFSKDGRSLFATTDRDGVRRIVLVALAGGAERILTPNLKFDVEALELSHDAGLAAFLTNEAGTSVLRFLDLATLKELPRPPLVDGVIADLAWRPGSREVGFRVVSARSAGDVFSYDVKANQLTRWTNGNNPRVNTRELAEPAVARWKGPDGREMTGLLYKPPSRFAGKRPVIAIAHGAASPVRPGFLGRDNYLIGELGVAMIHANARDARDVDALRDWIATQADLDAARVLVLDAAPDGPEADARFAAMAEFARR